MTDTTLTFNRGGSAAVQADEATSAARSFRRKVEYLANPGKGQSIFLRYLTDEPDWIWATVHAGLSTKNQPSDWPAEASWPKIMTPVCRYDDTFKKKRLAAGLPQYYPDCYPCDTKMQNNYGRVSNPAIRIWALACVREEVIGTPELIAKHGLDQSMVGKRIGFKDATRQVAKLDSDGKPTDEFTVEPRIVVVNRALSNYFQGLQSLAGVYGTVCDRDYLVKQIDEGKDIEFNHVPLDPDGLKPGTEAWARYDQAIKDQNLNCEQLVLKNSDDEFYGLFIDPNKTQPARKSEGNTDSSSGQQTAGAPQAQQTAAPSNDANPEILAAMRDRIKGLTADSAPGQIDFSA